MRKYEQIWLALKKDNVAAIAAVPVFHPRIIKAVIKEKDMDIGFKLLKDSEHKEAKLGYKVEGSRIRFFLNFKVKFVIDNL